MNSPQGICGSGCFTTDMVCVCVYKQLDPGLMSFKFYQIQWFTVGSVENSIPETSVAA